MRFRKGKCATGEIISAPSPLKLMNPRSNRWSIDGVSNSPFSRSGAPRSWRRARAYSGSRVGNRIVYSGESGIAARLA